MWERCKRSSCSSKRARSLGVMVCLIDVEVRGRDVDVEEIDATGELQWTRLGERASTRLQDVGDVLGAEGLEREAIGDGAGNVIPRIDLRLEPRSCGRGGGH